MDRPLIIGNVHNLSLEGYSDEQPQLVAQFPCHIEVNTCFYITNQFEKRYPKTCCYTIGLHNVSLFTVKNLTITPKTPNATGLVLHKVVNATIEQIEVYYIFKNITRSKQGIVLKNCHFIQMHSIIARNWEIGLEFYDSNNIYIHNVTASDNYETGMYTFNCSNFHMYSSSFTNNTISDGIGMYEGHNIVINNTTTEYNAGGIYFEHINTTQIVNTIASNNSHNGISLRKSTNINISNTTLSHNDGWGIYFTDINTAQIVNTIASNNSHNGIYLRKSTNINISNTTLSHNGVSGIYFTDINTTQIVNTIASNNSHNGISLRKSTNINISNTTLSHNDGWGIYFTDINTTQIVNTIASNNSYNGIYLRKSTNINISNTTLTHNRGWGIYFTDINTAQIVNTIASNNSYYGIYFRKSTNINISNTTLSHNDGWGIYFTDINTAQIVNTIASNNSYDGIYLWNSTNINISNTTLTHNDEDGLAIAYSSSIHIDGITITDNLYYGIYLYKTKWTYITRVTTIYKYSFSKYTGFKCIIIRYSQYISIYDTILTVNMSVVSSGELTSQPAVISLHNSTLNLSRCTFTGNRITGIKASASNITLSGNLTFSNNSAYTGAAFILLDNSILILTENCRVHFINNHATNTGGVFSIFNSQTFILSQAVYDDYDDIPTSNCFLRTQMDDSSTNNFIFSNNSAGKGGDIIYGGDLAYGVNNNKNCMDTFKEISYISDTSLSLISSDPLRVCLCNQRGLPDGMLIDDPTPHSIYSGQTISISAVVVNTKVQIEPCYEDSHWMC